MSQTYYLVEYTDPRILGQWGRLRAEVAETYTGPDAEAQAWAELRRRKAMLRWAGSRCTYYGVSDRPPAPPDTSPLRPFDPLDAGERLDDDY
jgi:hypothetical protein